MEWIKVSERLPEVNGFGIARVLVTCVNPLDPQRRNYVMDAMYEPNDEGRADFMAWDGYCEFDEELWNVIAWMPYPEPYTED